VLKIDFVDFDRANSQRKIFRFAVKHVPPA